jgi:hypothetical protein
VWNFWGALYPEVSQLCVWSYSFVFSGNRGMHLPGDRGTGNWMILTTVYNTQGYWVSGICPSSGISFTGTQNGSETGSVSVFRWGEVDTYSVGSIKKNWPQPTTVAWFELSGNIAIGRELGTYWTSRNGCLTIIPQTWILTAFDLNTLPSIHGQKQGFIIAWAWK